MDPFISCIEAGPRDTEASIPWFFCLVEHCYNQEEDNKESSPPFLRVVVTAKCLGAQALLCSHMDWGDQAKALGSYSHGQGEIPSDFKQESTLTTLCT